MTTDITPDGTHTPDTPGNRIKAKNLRVAYGSTTIIDDLSVEIPHGKLTTIIGPNGCGKSTLLRALSRLLPIKGGTITLDDKDITHVRRRKLAREIAVLPQSPIAPDGLMVADLVSRGRHPHQSWVNQWSTQDESEVARALELTKVSDLAHRQLESLSGGQRQRVWISMVLAQNTNIMFLDEPTTYLDMSHSIDILNLVQQLNHEMGRTVVTVLHDLNLAIRYSDHLIVMRDGEICATGSPAEIITSELLKSVFDLDAVVIEDPVVGGPMIVPNAPKPSDQ